MPKSLVYSYKTIDQSYLELKRKTQQLETMMGDQEVEAARVSRSSWKNIQDDTFGDGNLLDHKEVILVIFLSKNLQIIFRIIMVCFPNSFLLLDVFKEIITQQE